MTSFAGLNMDANDVSSDATFLPTQLQAIAEAELHEPATREGKLAAIIALRSVIAALPTGDPDRATDTSDCTLLRWLRAAKFDNAKALQKTRDYTKWWRANGSALANIDPKCADFACFHNFVRVLRGVDALSGKVVVCLTPKKALSAMTPKAAAHPNLFMRFQVWMLERLASDLQVQVCGMVMFNSFHGLTLYDGWTMQSLVGIAERRVVLGYFTILGVRLHAAMIFEEPLVIRWLFPIVRQFMSRKLRERLSLNGGRYEALDEVVPREQLPEPFCSGGRKGLGEGDQPGQNWVAEQVAL